jgi:DNA-binding PadR family transcriptional regulator
MVAEMKARFSPLEMALLALLRQQAQSGYDLRKLFITTPLRHYSDSPGSIYPALRRLAARKWVRVEAVKNSARKREVFHVTGAGRRALVDWLQQPITRDDVVWGLDPVLLRFAFLDGNVSRKVTARFLADLERHLEAYVEELEAYAADSGLLRTPSTGALAFSNGLGNYRAQLAWTRHAREQLLEKNV